MEITEERMSRLLAGVKIDIGLASSTYYDERLKTYIESATAQIEREGVNLAEDSVDNNVIIQEYARWKWTTRDAPVAMPRPLRLSLNNLLMQQKMRRTEE